MASVTTTHITVKNTSPGGSSYPVIVQAIVTDRNSSDQTIVATGATNATFTGGNQTQNVPLDFTYDTDDRDNYNFGIRIVGSDPTQHLRLERGYNNLLRRWDIATEVFEADSGLSIGSGYQIVHVNSADNIPASGGFTGGDAMQLFSVPGKYALTQLALIAKPTPNFTGTPRTGLLTDVITSIAVQFTDVSTGSPTSWLWDFGDTNTSTSQNPLHSYTSPGRFTVSLTATNGNGSNIETKIGYIFIDALGEHYPLDCPVITPKLDILPSSGVINQGTITDYTVGTNQLKCTLHPAVPVVPTRQEWYKKLTTDAESKYVLFSAKPGRVTHIFNYNKPYDAESPAPGDPFGFPFVDDGPITV